MSARMVTASVTIVATSCGNCGIQFGLDANFKAAREADGASFYCPNGHFIGWAGHNREKQLETQLAAARSLGRLEAERRLAAERQRAAAKGQVTKIKNRVAKGVCPCCNRTFANLARHMDGQHPDWTATS